MRILLLCLLLLSFAQISAQTYSKNRDRFSRELERAMRQHTSANMNQFTREELYVLLNETDLMPDAYFERMVETCNLMEEKRLKAYPEIYFYVYSMMTIVIDKQPKESYEAWHDAVDRMLSRRSMQQFKGFIEVSGAFFTNGIIALNPNFEWVYRGGNYKFTYEEGPMIAFSEGTLLCRTINRGRDSKENPYTDSIVLDNTQGVYDMLRERWEGSGGLINWQKNSLPKEETFAKISNYRVSMKATNFSCDTVILTTPYFETEVAGKLIDRAQRGTLREEQELNYPQFQSFEQQYEIKEFLKGVDYKGGFSLQGAAFIGEGSQTEPAELIFHRNGKPFIRTASSRVSVSDQKLFANNCRVSLYIALQDSIYHPGLNFSFIKDDDRIIMARGNSGLSQSPFVNSYHKLNMFVEELSWKRSDNELDLGFNFATSQQQRTARFESFGYYDEQLFQRLQGMSTVNPLMGLWAYAYKYDEYVLPEGKAATALNQTITQAKGTLLELSALGFISYDLDQGIVTITPKLEHFVKAKGGKVDYDNIMFAADLTPKRIENYSVEQLAANKNLADMVERTRERNRARERMQNYGTIHLGTLEMALQAIDVVPISQGKNTQVFPDGNDLVIKENRQFVFTGWINSGKWEIHVEEGNYDYTKNGFNIFKSDVAFFRSSPLLPEHGADEKLIQSPINGVKGELIVDDINNRAGLKAGFDHFPKLLCKEKTRVYYDQRSLFRGAYDRERFYFEIDPFQMDSLATFNEKHIRFGGELTSAGIFPKIRDSLKIMNDYSLGFSRKAPEKGYEFYGTEARYENQILLSNNGLQGGGAINFINSTSTSKRLFTFLPDSTVGVATFVNRPQEKGVEFPDIDGPDAYITFIPRNQTLRARSNNELLKFFEGEAKLRGETVVRAEGIRGKGYMQLDGANMTAKNFRFSRWVTESDTAVFNLENKYREPGDLTEDPMAFKTDNVTAYVDFKERKGEFKSNDGTTVVEFPVNKYICKIDMFTWLMDSDDIEMATSDDDDLSIESDLDLVGPNFYSIHPKQDSLQFKSPKATFSLKEKTIYCNETRFIEVADARIFPDSAKVIIRKNAKMDPLENSRIIANYITQYHTIDSATTLITGRRAYTSKGFYPYYDIDSNLYKIYLPEVRLDSTYQTVAFGEIKDDDGFKLSDYFEYYGKVVIKAADPTLSFKGATRIVHDCEKFERNWMSFDAPINPQNIQIPVSSAMTDLYGNPITAGILWRHSQDLDSVMLYPTFLSAYQDDNDPIVITASGYLQYNVDAREYQIASKEKLNNRGEKGNYLSLHTGTCSLNGDGKVYLGMDYGDFEVESVGVVNYNQATEETSMNLTLMIKSILDEKIFENMAKKINDVQGLNPADFSSTTLEQAILEWVDRETADRIVSDYTLDKRIRRVPREMRNTMVITGVRLSSHKADEQTIGLRTNVDQAAIVNIYSEPVMKYVPFKLFAQQRTIMDDRFTMMIDIPAGYMYFFDYDKRKDGIMTIVTSDKDMMTDIKDLKNDKKKDRRFSYDVAPNSPFQNQFLRIFK
jgi:hypothetical protein